MKKLSFLICLTSFIACSIASASPPKKLWTTLFDGKTLKGWRKASKDAPPDSAWSVKNGELIFDPSTGHGGDIVTAKSFKNLDFSVEFKVSEGGNSGIKYFLLPNSSLGCEYQVIDDLKHADAKLGINGNRKTASLYDVMPSNTSKLYKPAGQWNTARIVARGNHVEHWLNGGKVLAYERGSESFKKAIGESKFKTTKGFAEATSSPILLQAHGDKVSFKNIQIKEL